MATGRNKPFTPSAIPPMAAPSSHPDISAETQEDNDYEWVGGELDLSINEPWMLVREDGNSGSSRSPSPDKEMKAPMMSVIPSDSIIELSKKSPGKTHPESEAFTPALVGELPKLRPEITSAPLSFEFKDTIGSHSLDLNDTSRSELQDPKHSSDSPLLDAKDTSSSPSQDRKDTSSSPSQDRKDTSSSPSQDRKDTSSSPSQDRKDTSSSPSQDRKDTSSSPSQDRKDTSRSASLDYTDTTSAPPLDAEHTSGSPSLDLENTSRPLSLGLKSIKPASEPETKARASLLSSESSSSGCLESIVPPFPTATSLSQPRSEPSPLETPYSPIRFASYSSGNSQLFQRGNDRNHIISISPASLDEPEDKDIKHLKSEGSCWKPVKQCLTACFSSMYHSIKNATKSKSDKTEEVISEKTLSL